MSTPSLREHVDANGQVPVPADVSSLISVIERAATDPAIDADKMEKLVGLYERLMAHRARAAFNASFAELQSEMPEITENGTIKHGDKVISSFARFDEDIHDVVKPILRRHGFSLMFKPQATDEGYIHMRAVLMHREGHSEDADIKLPADTSGSKNGVQSMGSSSSYAKRYLIVPMLNIKTCGEDDDGVAGGAKLITEEQVLELQKMISEYGVDQKGFLVYMRVSNLTRIPSSQFENAKAALEKKRAAAAAKKGGK